MSQYTLIDDPHADDIINADLSFVVGNLREFFGDRLEAILLAGGFGRGEGAVVKEKDNYRPVNDYDIVAVVRQSKKTIRSEEKRLSELGHRLQSNISVKQVDIMVFQLHTLAIPYPTILRYEIKHGCKLLHGDKIPTIRCVPESWIPLSEGTKYFRNRCGGLLIARLLLDGFGNFATSQRIELVALEINKAFLALGDAFLIEHHDYNFSYAKRKQIFVGHCEQYGVPDQITELYIHSIDDKLTPRFLTLSRQEVAQQWLVAAQKLEENLLRFESVRLRAEFRNLEEYELHVLRNSHGVRRSLNKLSSLYQREDSKNIAVKRIVAFLLLHSYSEKKGEDLVHLSELLGVETSSQLGWADLTKKFLQSWHPDGIVLDVIERKLDGND